MNKLLKSSMLCASSMLLGALTVVSMRLAVSAEPAKPAADATQNPVKVPPPKMTPEQQAISQRAQQVPRDIAMAIMAADIPSPRYIVNVGGFNGGMLAAWLEKVPSARGQWTETTDHKTTEAVPILGKYGDRVDYKLGCSFRDMTEQCFPPQTDVIVTSGQSIHRNLDGMYKNFIATYKLLPKHGWFINIDQIGFGYSQWESLLMRAKVGFLPKDRVPEHPELRIPTAQEELEAMKSAGFDAQIVYQSFNTAVFMGRKN
jgi:hypothetical protein